MCASRGTWVGAVIAPLHPLCADNIKQDSYACRTRTRRDSLASGKERRKGGNSDAETHDQHWTDRSVLLSLRQGIPARGKELREIHINKDELGVQFRRFMNYLELEKKKKN